MLETSFGWASWQAWNGCNFLYSIDMDTENNDPFCMVCRVGLRHQGIREEGGIILSPITTKVIQSASCLTQFQTGNIAVTLSLIYCIRHKAFYIVSTMEGGTHVSNFNAV